MNPLCIGPLVLDSRVLLAPMAGYTDLPFRRMVRRLGGVGLAFTELLNPRSIVRGGGRKRTLLLATSQDDAPLSHQIYGKDPAIMAEAAKWLQDHGAIALDINMGCPQKKISARGAGAGLLKNQQLAVEIARAMVAAVSIPVSVKMRLGWDAASRVAAAIAADLEQAGVAAVTVHARTKMQGYSGTADWDGIAEVVAGVRRIPVIGNGDVDSPASARAMLARTGCSGVMVGRAAIANPWLIRDISNDLEGRAPAPAPSRRERLAFSRKHFGLMSESYGERIAVLLFRKWLPLYAKGLGMDRQAFVRLAQTDSAETLSKGIGWDELGRADWLAAVETATPS